MTATAAIETFWTDDAFAADVRRKGDVLTRRIEEIIARYPGADLRRKGRGMMQGIEMESGDLASAVVKECFRNKLIIETSGADDQVVKFLCPLVISDDDLLKGLSIVEAAVGHALKAQADAESEKVSAIAAE